MRALDGETLALDRHLIKAMSMPLDEAEDEFSAKVEGLVQALVKVALRRSERIGLDGSATMLATIEVAARVAIALRPLDLGGFAQGRALFLFSTIAARAAGHAPGELDVPRDGESLQ